MNDLRSPLPFLLFLATAACLTGATGAADSVAISSVPLALRGVPPRRISEGVFSSLVGSGAFGGALAPRRPNEAGLAPAAGIKGTPPAVATPA